MCGLKKALMAGFREYEYILELGCIKMETSSQVGPDITVYCWKWLYGGQLQHILRRVKLSYGIAFLQCA